METQYSIAVHSEIDFFILGKTQLILSIIFSEYDRVDIGIKLFLVLLAHRILRKLNSTGDKYAHLPDISDWFLDKNNKIGLSLLLILGIIIKNLC